VDGKLLLNYNHKAFCIELYINEIIYKIPYQKGMYNIIHKLKLKNCLGTFLFIFFCLGIRFCTTSAGLYNKYYIK